MTTTKAETLGDDYLDDAKERWNRTAGRNGRQQAGDADWDPKNPRRIVISNVNGELGAYTVGADGELVLERGAR